MFTSTTILSVLLLLLFCCVIWLATQLRKTQDVVRDHIQINRYLLLTIKPLAQDFLQRHHDQHKMDDFLPGEKPPGTSHH